MEILDAQLHADAEHPVEQHLVMMRDEGVCGAVLVQTIPQGFDNSYLLNAAARYPGAFAVVGVLDAAAADIAGDVAAWRANPYAMGLRLVILSEDRQRLLREGYYESLLAAAESLELPLFIYAPRMVAEVDALAGRHPGLQLILDHLGLPQPPVLEESEDPWSDLPKVLRLAARPNIAIKCSGAPTLSNEVSPFRDVWPKIHKVIEAFGVDRTLWGSDITRISVGHPYAEAVAFIRDTDELTSEDKRWLMGAALRKVCRWKTPDVGGSIDAR